MVLSKFIQDFARNSKSSQKIIEEEVNAFFKNEKITEENLRALKSRITNLLAGAKPSENKSQTSKK